MYEATKEQITAWKKAHGEVFQADFEDKRCYLKRPSRAGFGFATATSKGDPMAFNEAMITDMWLDGDQEIQNEDKYFYGLSAKISELIETKEATLLKL